MKISKIPGLGRFGSFVDEVDFDHITDEEWLEIGKLHLNSLVTIIRNTNLTKTKYIEQISKWGTPRDTASYYFTKKHHITPKGIAKAVHDILEGARSDVSTNKQHLLKVAEEQAYYAALSPEALAKKIKQLEREMFHYAKNLQFEEAAEVRDQLKKLKEKIIGIDCLITAY